MKLRLLRIGDHLDEDTVLVRGGELDPGVLRADARRYHEVYGTYGISLFAVRGMALDEMAQQVPLIRFRGPTLITARATCAFCRRGMLMTRADLAPLSGSAVSAHRQFPRLAAYHCSHDRSAVR